MGISYTLRVCSYGCFCLSLITLWWFQAIPYFVQVNWDLGDPNRTCLMLEVPWGNNQKKRKGPNIPDVSNKGISILYYSV